MRCAILQPSYIPWRGYFHQIQLADFFVFYDDVQYDKHGWRNRNRIKTPQGTQWLTIPVKNRGNIDGHRTILETEIDWQRSWNQKHFLSLRNAYRKAPYFAEWEQFLSEVYSRKSTYLAPFTIDLTINIARKMGNLHTRFLRSSELGISGLRTGRLVAIAKHLGCDRYLSGPSAKDYLDEEGFLKAGVTLEYMKYAYPEYQQMYPPFDPHVSILDLLFMTGPRARDYIG